MMLSTEDASVPGNQKLLTSHTWPSQWPELVTRAVSNLTCKFKIWDLLAEGTNGPSVANVTSFWIAFVLWEGNSMLSPNVRYLKENLGKQSVGHEWSLFIDSSNLILKAVLFLNENKHLSVPVTLVMQTTSTLHSSTSQVINTLDTTANTWEWSHFALVHTWTIQISVCLSVNGTDRQTSTWRRHLHRHQWFQDKRTS